MAAAAAKLCSSKKISIFDSLKKLKDVNGRLELISTFSNIKVFIDFAHTPDALLKTLNEIKSSIGENISLVFGCGGERDFKKRALMAKIASKIAKKFTLQMTTLGMKSLKILEKKLLNILVTKITIILEIDLKQ